jgi:predicted Zn-dependent protease
VILTRIAILGGRARSVVLIEELGGYRIEGELARGGMGVVYRALDPRSGRRVALKLLLDTDDRFRQRFARESQTLARLNHPNVVRVHDAGEARGAPYLVMELVEGTSLGEQLRQGPLDVRRAAEIVAKVARGAGHAHARGLVHRDIKPDNVLVRPDGTVVLTDFGLARDVAVSSDLSKTGIFLGTPGYASPEQAAGEGKHVGPASDVYGLGALLFALLCGCPPWQGALLEIVVATISEPAPSARASNPEVDPALDALCLRCMAKDPAERFAQGDALAEALEAYLRGELDAPVRTGFGGFLALGSLTVLALGAAAAFALSDRDPAPVAAAPTASFEPTPNSSEPPVATKPPLKHSRVLARALRRTEKVREGEELDTAIKVFVKALERVGPASNRAEAERRLAELYTLRSGAVLRRSPAESVADLRAARELEDTMARREALSAALLRNAMVRGGAMAKGVEWDLAKQDYREAMSLAPNDPRPALQLGDQARARKDWETWLSATQEVVRRAPEDEIAQVQVARALAKADRRGEALVGLRQFLGRQPEAAVAWREVGDLERAGRRWGKARQAYERAGGEASQDSLLLEGLAFVALHEQRPELALKLAQRATAGSKRDMLAPVRALATHAAGDPKGALRYYEQAWRREESEPWSTDLALGHLDALRSTGGKAGDRLYYYLKEEDLGEYARLVLRLIHNAETKRDARLRQALLSAIDEAPLGSVDPRAACALSEWLSRWGTYTKPNLAVDLARRARQSSPDDEDGRALVYEGRALMRRGDHLEAWRALDAALALQPNRADLHHIRAELGASSGRYAPGLASGKRAIELRPTEPYSRIYLSWCLLGIGRPREALEPLDFARRRLGKSVLGLRALARACAGELEGAEQDLKEARAQDPKSREVRLAAAELLARKGDPGAAIRVFEAALEEKLYPFQRDLIKAAIARARGE